MHGCVFTIAQHLFFVVHSLHIAFGLCIYPHPYPILFFPLLISVTGAWFCWHGGSCDPGSNPGVNTICGLSLLLVLFLAPRGFSQGSTVFPFPWKPALPNSNSMWNAWTRFNEFLKTPKCSMGKQITIITMACNCQRAGFAKSGSP